MQTKRNGVFASIRDGARKPKNRRGRNPHFTAPTFMGGCVSSFLMQNMQRRVPQCQPFRLDPLGPGISMPPFSSPQNDHTAHGDLSGCYFHAGGSCCRIALDHILANGLRAGPRGWGIGRGLGRGLRTADLNYMYIHS